MEGLADRLGVSGKTIRRDLDILRELGAEIVQMHHGGNFHLRNMMFEIPTLEMVSGEQVFSLMVAVEALRAFRFSPMASDMEMIRDRIRGGMEEIAKTYRLAQDKVSYIPAPVGFVDTEVFKTVRHALINNRVLQIAYISRTNMTSNRSVCPLHLRGYRGTWYLYAWCRSQEAPRLFHLSRIQEAHAGKESFNPRLQLYRKPLEDFLSRSDQMFISDEIHECAIRFAPEAAREVRERAWYENLEIREESDGSITMTFRVPSLVEVFRFVMRWGGSARVLAPEELKTMVKEAVEEMARIYGMNEGGEQ